MKNTTIAAAVCAAIATAAYAADNPFEAFKGKMKPGMYEMKMDMDMGAIPGMPPGMGKQSHTMQHCVTEQDMEKGAFSRGRDGKSASDCKIENMKTSGNTATYTMVCPQMKADNKITFNGNGYVMDMKMNMDQGGKPMTMNQHVESKYIGPCTK